MAISQKAFMAFRKQVASGALSVELYHEIVWEEYHNFVWHTVEKCCFKPALKHDCFQEASIMFFHKLPAYEPERAAFTTFIQPWLKRAVYDFIFLKQSPVKMCGSVCYKLFLSKSQPDPTSVFSKARITRFGQLKDTRDGINQTSARADLEKMARKLTKRQKAITFSYFGIGCKAEDYRTIAIRYSLSHQRIEQIVTDSLRKMGWKPRQNEQHKRKINY